MDENQTELEPVSRVRHNVLITVHTINSQISPQLSSQLDLLEAEIEMMITQSDE
jgi:hypothetical protein